MKTLIIFFAFIFLFLCGCTKKKVSQQSRPFYMAVTPWPADFTQQAVDDAYNFITQHCDMVSHHFDEGIPYEEAYKNL